jgi:hypothetical protein
MDEVRYLAFCDILGFSDRILKNFDEAVAAYREFAETTVFSDDGIPLKKDDTQTTIYSDAVLITGTSLDGVLSAARGVSFFALLEDLMIRGAVTQGRYWEQRSGNSLMVVSDALVRAVKLEQMVSVPAVVVADDVVIPDEFWLVQFSRHLAETPLLHFRDRNIVNPFNPGWLKSAAGHAGRLMEAHPKYKDKYLWFLALYEAVMRGRPMIPPGYVERYLEEGKLKRNEPDQNTTC